MLTKSNIYIWIRGCGFVFWSETVILNTKLFLGKIWYGYSKPIDHEMNGKGDKFHSGYAMVLFLEFDHKL